MVTEIQQRTTKIVPASDELEHGHRDQRGLTKRQYYSPINAKLTQSIEPGSFADLFRNGHEELT